MQELQRTNYMLMASMGLTPANPIDLSTFEQDNREDHQETNNDKHPLSQDPVTLEQIAAQDKANKQAKDKEQRKVKKRGERLLPKEQPPARVLKAPDEFMTNGLKWKRPSPLQT